MHPSMLTSSLVVSIMILAGASSAEEFPRPTVDYSADLIMKVWDGRDDGVVRGKVYAAGGKERREFGAPGSEVISIVDRHRGVSYVLLPGQRMYMEQHPSPEGAKRDDPAGGWYNADVTLVSLGEEAVNGLNGRKFRISVVERGGVSTSAGFVWLSAENIPLRMRGSSTSRGSTVEFQIDHQNVRIEKQIASLFRVPGDYRRIDVAGPPPSMRSLEDIHEPPAQDAGADNAPSDVQRQVEEMERQLSR